MRKLKSLKYLVIALFTGLTSCYQKKAPKNEKIISFIEEKGVNDTIVEGLNIDSMMYVDTFKLIPLEVVLANIHKNAKKTPIYIYPTFEKSDTLKLEQQIVQLAISHLYLSIGEKTKNMKLHKQAKEKNKVFAQNIWSDSIVYPENVKCDSLNNWLKNQFLISYKNSEYAYFESIIWLEQLFLTINNYKNVKNQKNLELVINQHFENGTELLERLSNYQNYQPINEFSNLLISLLDYKYSTFDAKQLNEIINETRIEILKK